MNRNDEIITFESHCETGKPFGLKLKFQFVKN